MSTLQWNRVKIMCKNLTECRPNRWKRISKSNSLSFWCSSQWDKVVHKRSYQWCYPTAAGESDMMIRMQHACTYRFMGLKLRHQARMEVRPIVYKAYRHNTDARLISSSDFSRLQAGEVECSCPVHYYWSSFACAADFAFRKISF